MFMPKATLEAVTRFSKGLSYLIEQVRTKLLLTHAGFSSLGKTHLSFWHIPPHGENTSKL
jgi:hypothetical protein